MAHNQSQWGVYYTFSKGTMEEENKIIEEFSGICKNYHNNFKNSDGYGICFGEYGSRFSEERGDKLQPYYVGFLTKPWFKKILPEFKKVVDKNIYIDLVTSSPMNLYKKVNKWGEEYYLGNTGDIITRENLAEMVLLKITLDKEYNKYSRFFLKYLMGTFFRVLGYYEHYISCNEPEPDSALDLLLERNNSAKHNWSGDVHSACEVGLTKENLKLLMDIDKINNLFSVEKLVINPYKYSAILEYGVRPQQTDVWMTIFKHFGESTEDKFIERTFALFEDDSNFKE